MKLLSLFALILFTINVALAQDDTFVLMTTHTEGLPQPRLEAIVLIDHGQFKSPGGLKNKDSAAFIKKYLPTGRKFYVIFGGGAAGTINLTETGLGCNNQIYASGPFEPGSLGISRIRGPLQGLATTSDRIARSEIWRRAPSTGERNSVLTLAKEVFSKHGLTTSQLAKMQIANLTAIDVDGDNNAELVGTFRLHSSDPSRHPPRYVFLIAEGQGSNYTTAFSTYRAFPDSEIFNIGDETLVDYVDLNRDGVAEIVSSYSSDGEAGYHIYRRVDGTWKVVYEYATEFCVS